MDRCVLLTGCSSGIGHAAALAFREEEWDVVATARNEADLNELAEYGCHTAELDVTNADQAVAVVEQAIAACGRLDCLVNNAGFSSVGPMEDITSERLREQFEVNVFGPHRLTRAVLPHMRARGNGTVINVSSNLGRVSLPGAGAYAASKFSIEAMSDAMRAELSPLGVDVVVVEPGPVSTSFRARARRELEIIERTDDYSSLYGIIDDWASIDGFGPADLDSREVADVIVNAASATQPAARYPVGTVARLANVARFVPDRIRDSMYRVVLRATALRSSR